MLFWVVLPKTHSRKVRIYYHHNNKNMNALTEDDPSDTDYEATPQGIAIIPPHNEHLLLPNYLITLPKENECYNDDVMVEESGEMCFGGDSDFDGEVVDDLGIEPDNLLPLDDTNELTLDTLENQVFIGRGAVNLGGDELKVVRVPND